VDDLFVSRPLQEAALELVTSPAWERHLKTLGQSLGRRSAALLDAVSRHLPAVSASLPAGGMHLWATLPRDTGDLEAAEAASRSHVIVMPGRPFFPAEAPAPHLRLTFCAAADEAELDAGVRRLATAVPELTQPAN
jgi:DNA-binding transcriptional MocR family regulator